MFLLCSVLFKLSEGRYVPGTRLDLSFLNLYANDFISHELKLSVGGLMRNSPNSKKLKELYCKE